jgi:hypothetical protein
MLQIFCYLLLLFALILNLYQLLPANVSRKLFHGHLSSQKGKPAAAACKNTDDGIDSHSTPSSAFKKLCLFTFLCACISLIFLFAQALVETKDIEIIDKDIDRKVRMSLSLSHNVFQCCCNTIYTFALINRFKRLDLVLQNSVKEKFLLCLQWELVVVCCVIVMAEMFQKIYRAVTDLPIDNFRAVLGLVELLQAILVVVMEFVINVRLVRGTLRCMNGQGTSHLDAANSQQNNIQDIYKSLRRKMLFLFSLLFFMDFVIASCFVLQALTYTSPYFPTRWGVFITGFMVSLMNIQ